MTRTIGELIASADSGDAAAAGTLFETLYRELRQMARRELNRRGDASSLGATTLLHEAYLEMARRAGATFPDRARFMAYAARVMRGLILDHARYRRARKRGGAFEITTFDVDVHAPSASPATGLDDLGRALAELDTIEPRLAEVVDLKFFCGFSFVEIATMHGVSERTVQRDWEKARVYLHGALTSGD